MAVSSGTDQTGEDFAIYVHWPFCLHKCPYCDFNSHVREQVDQDRWRQAYEKEIAAAAGRYPQGPATSVFFGGGTPSLMDPETTGRIIAAINDHWGLAAGAEITLEANPTSVEAGRFADYKAAGVNRLSLGIQALNDADLRALGRQHDLSQALAALEIARDIFPRYSFDLIYARMGQSPESWREELGEALKLAGGHLSLYQLTIEKGTQFYQRHRSGDLVIPEEEPASEMYEATRELCEAAGLPAYEISNHARPGEESRHNLTYWRYGSYAGIGPGAHGRVGQGNQRLALRQKRSPEAWLSAVEGKGDTEEITALAKEDQASEMLMMGLRMAQGVSAERFRQLTGLELFHWIDPGGLLADLIGHGLVEDRRDHLRLTPEGRALTNIILDRLIP